jgi:hypothetical protein
MALGHLALKMRVDLALVPRGCLAAGQDLEGGREDSAFNAV